MSGPCALLHMRDYSHGGRKAGTTIIKRGYRGLATTRIIKRGYRGLATTSSPTFQMKGNKF